MSIRVALNHRTHYRFDRPVSLSPHEVRLRPAPHCRTRIHSYSLNIRPADHFINWQQDPYGNYLARLVFPERATELEVVVDVVADMTVINPFDFFVEPSAERFPFTYAPQLRKELVPFLEVDPPGPLLGAWLERFKNANREESNFINDFLVRLNQRLQKDIDYIVRLEPGVQTCEQTLQSRRGSCRDSGWLLVQILRNFGLAARFASGYLIQLVADVKPLDGPAGPKQDFTDLHAWAEVYIPGAGWIGLDPTSGLLAGEGHIPLACTASPSSAAPVIGSTGVCESELDFRMTVTRIHEDPRVTKPYTDEQWRAIEALGLQVDVDLQAGDVRLTMGGEPTFVSIDDMEGAEWNTDALGPTKRKLAGDVLKRLKSRFAPGGLLHYGQGKWYPGEVLPRWALGCYWRLDGEPVWNDPTLIADESVSYGYSADHAQKFAARLAERLNLDPAFAIPAYEDVWHYLMEEQKLPVNVDPLQKDLKDPAQRRTLARLLDRGLGEVAGYVLPLREIAPPRLRRSGPRKARWISGPWPLKRGRLYLLPGDSPMGYRLPLTSLPWVAPDDVEIEPEQDPLEAREPLGPAGSRPRGSGAPDQRQLALNTAWAVGESARDVLRTALCVEVRQGRLHVFMPPQAYVEDYLDLVIAVEETAAELQSPLWVEGYPPSYDPRLQSFKVTPDPGVIEVNIHPAKTWDELVSNTHILYEEARQSRLGTEKFMLDGRHTGTGGGNHITLGGPTPADSPMLRRPDLLRSLTTYWLNHPGLSYLFSGMFVGPTSQAPRVDEARHDHLYELEIAFQQMTAKQQAGQGTPTPWLVDRLLRHLLVDLTGNTHRAEFSIDKLYSPDSATGRLGLVEFRAFEMPPHPRMSLSQMLLLRALVAKFWNQPYHAPVVRWGTELHDRFMLPHFVSQDMKDVLGDLQAGGYAFHDEWFAPFLEFRFPRYGSVVYDNIELELRQAIEPWHVLGEEAVAGATARHVDSSVERIQVKVNGMIDPRHVVMCNGRPVPLHPTGTRGEFVAGVRYRAWQPPSGLHPTIPVQSPLVFDLVDTWAGRAIGGCTYHVVHPGGRSSPSFPVNANEAEARRAARFWDHGHTPGPMTIQPEERNRDFPFTLDLRRSPASS
ncbi:MAG: transglutaminase family protein [Nitrospira sp.]|nr:transglutaminase family protein [Nitrospira sp.]